MPPFSGLEARAVAIVTASRRRRLQKARDLNAIEHKMALANKQILAPKSERVSTP
jgi:hypothetical protein